ncbi:MAG TPA: SRPBCC family protein [Sphingopyxis sp.]|uniref:SRPBCC family protein n=1 Tax=Sphingopyxis sp. TaxID=1908224 RepID=UPI002E311ADD|nr:SRPBCC family protein [Sphingopyxis sp.]HEX2814487.1 SRPBCC family protein [Sphingopyxis sp.]
MKPTKKTRRTDHAERLIAAPLPDVFAAFTSAAKLARWLPPEGATGAFDHCDLRAGGGFRLRLTFDDPDIETKSDDDSDIVEVHIPTLDDGRLIVWEVEFESDDPRFSGTMAMHWYLSRKGGGTLVTIDAHQVPPGISAKDHQAGLSSSLANLAAVVE